MKQLCEIEKDELFSKLYSLATIFEGKICRYLNVCPRPSVKVAVCEVTSHVRQKANVIHNPLGL